MSADADAATIAFAISESRLQGDINAQVLDKAEEWLLQAEVGAKYDAQLKQEDAHSASNQPCQHTNRFSPIRIKPALRLCLKLAMPHQLRQTTQSACTPHKTMLKQSALNSKLLK